jgi:hypothetical protein
MAEKVAAAEQKTQDGSIDAGSFLNVLGDAIKGAMEQGARAVNPKRDNPNYVPSSDRAPAGVDRETLTRRYIYKGVVQEDTQLTGEEISLLNQVTPCARTIVAAGLPREFVVTQENKGSIPDLKIDFPLSIEERAYFPSLVKVLKALISGASTIE